jgi:hypothetical protein
MNIWLMKATLTAMCFSKLKKGLCQLAEVTASNIQTRKLARLNITTADKCDVCEVLHNKIQGTCAKSICNRIKQEIKADHFNLGGIYWTNCNIRDWTSRSWDIAKCYIGQGHNHTHDSAINTDTSGILQFTVNGEQFTGKLFQPTEKLL